MLRWMGLGKDGGRKDFVKNLSSHFHDCFKFLSLIINRSGYLLFNKFLISHLMIFICGLQEI